MTRLILKRLLGGLLILWVISIVVFVATQTLPGDAAQAILGRESTPARLAALRNQLNLNGSPVSQYFHWFTGVIRLDFGTSLANGRPVTTVIGPLLANSLVLMAIAAVISTPIALWLGTWSAMRRDKPVDHVTGAATLVMAAVPEFVVGMILIIIFATALLKVLPAVYVGTGAAWENPLQLVLPVAALVLSVGPYITRSMRATMLEVLESQYVQQARLKGLPERTVILRHAVPNAVGPVIQVIALQLAYLMGGVVVIEFLFRYPGIGSELIDSVRNRDLPIIQALTLIIAAVYILVNLIADIVGLIANPKVRTAAQ